jgi:hypothetical protein
MQLLPVALGALLGLGGLLIWRGFRTVIDKSLSDVVRRKGFWSLNIGLTMVAISIIAFGMNTRG